MRSAIQTLTHTISPMPLWLQTSVAAAESFIGTPRCGSNYEDKSVGFGEGSGIA
jgi:hypothetical protein